MTVSINPVLTDSDEESAPMVDVRKRKKTIDSPFIHRMQRRHFVLFDVLPALGTVLAIVLLPIFPVTPIEIGLFAGMWFVTGIGITVGYHRLFTHRTFQAVPWVRVALAISASMAGQGGVISWASLHRRHHEYSDLEGDPHSPNLHGKGFGGRFKGLIHSHLTWMAQHEYPSTVHYTPDLLRDRAIVKVDQYYQFWVVLGLLIPAVLGAALHGGTWQGAVSGLLWGGVVRMFVLEHIIWSINSFLHTFGSRPFQTTEFSHNSALFSLVTLGESWHNNHHAFPHSASFGLYWYRLDPGYWFIATLRAFGLVYDVKVPEREKIQARATMLAARNAAKAV